MITSKFTLVTKLSIESKDREIPRLNPFTALDFEGGFLEIGDFLDISITFGSTSDRAALAAAPLSLTCFA